MYEDYSKRKGWNYFFAYSKMECELFEKEFLGCNFRNSKILEIGFGNGSFLRWAQKKGAEIAGTEIQDELIKNAREKGIDAKKEISEFHDRKFDYVVAFDVFEHLTRTEIKNIFLQIKKICHSNSFVVCRFPNSQSPLSLINQYGDHTHQTCLSGPIFQYYAELQGFEVIEIREAFNPINANNLFKKILKKIQAKLQKLILNLFKMVFSTGDIPMSANIIVVLKVNNENCN